MTGLASLKNRISTALADKQFDVAREALIGERQSLDEECLVILGRLEAQLGNFQEAVEIFQQAVSKEIKIPDAYYYLGAALEELGRKDDALEAYLATLNLNPSCDMAHCNMGSIYFHQGARETAEISYRAAIRGNPRNTSAYSNLGLLLKIKDDFTGAHECFQSVLAITPGCPETYYNIGRTYSKQMKDPLAKQAYQKALSCASSLRGKPYQWNTSPEFLMCSCYEGLANIARKRDNRKQAINCYKKALKIDPEHASSLHFLATMGEIPQPPRASDRYVADLFDAYAESFDDHLVAGLKYHIPDILCEMISKKLNVSQPALDVVDLGCGTGLCGPLLRPMARTLTGIDLSPKMIGQAQRRAVYDELLVAEIGAALQHTEAEFDLVVAADVLVYIGDTVPFFNDCHKVLRPNGWLAISLEKTAKGWTLNKSGRYAHSVHYVTETAESCGFKIVEIYDTNIRVENGVPVAGFIVLAQSQTAGDGM